MKRFFGCFMMALFISIGCSGGGGGESGGGNTGTCQPPFEASGNTCVCPDSAPVQVGNTCEACSGGRTWDGDSCECASGYSWNGAACLIQCTPPFVANQGGTACVCPTGKHQEGNTCVDDVVTCTGGRTWNGSSCVCPTGQSWDGDSCECPAGYDWNGAACIIHCTAPFVPNQGGTACVCPDGQHQVGDTCETCTGGRLWDGDSCECGSGWVWNGVSCEPNTCMDTISPTMGIEYSSDGLYSYNAPITRFKGSSHLFVEMFDNLGGSGINRIELKVDGQPICTNSTVEYHSGGDPNPDLYFSSCYWDTTSVSDGQHNLTIAVYDNCENRVQVSETITVDNRCGSDLMWWGAACVPQVIFEWPMSGRKVAERVEITLETHGSINHVQLKLNGSVLGPVLNPYYGTFWYNWDTTTVPDGSYTLTAEAWDDSGNVFQADHVNFIVQNSPDFCAGVRDLNGKYLKNCGESVDGLIEIWNDPETEACEGYIHLDADIQRVHVPDFGTAEYSRPIQSGGTLTVHLWVQDEPFTCQFY